MKGRVLTQKEAEKTFRNAIDRGDKLAFDGKILGFSKAVARSAEKVIKREPVKVDPAVFEQRWDICKRCDEFRPGKKDSKKGSCKICGCNMHWKARWASERCPIGKWEADGYNKESQELANVEYA